MNKQKGESVADRKTAPKIVAAFISQFIPVVYKVHIMLFINDSPTYVGSRIPHPSEGGW